MADARRREAWSHTSFLLSMLANVHRNTKKKPRPYSPNDFNPFTNKSSHQTPKADIRILKQVFVDSSR